MRKIANLTEHSRIDTTRGDVDEYTSGALALVRRTLWDSRVLGLRMLQQKYEEVRDVVRFVQESGRFVDLLPAVRSAIEKSREGLLLYRTNTVYRGDNEVQSTIEHLLEDEIPAQLRTLDTCLSAHGCSHITAPVTHSAAAPRTRVRTYAEAHEGPITPRSTS